MVDMRSDEKKKEFSDDIRSGLEEAFDKYANEGGDTDGDSREHEESGVHDSERGSESEQEESGSESTREEVHGSGEQESGDEEDVLEESSEEDSEDSEELEEDSEEDSEYEYEEDDEDDSVDKSQKLEPGTLEPHVTWPEHIKEEFRALPAKSQRFLAESFKGMQADYTRKMQAISGVNRALEPIRGKLVENGISEENAIGELVQNYLALESRPAEAIKRLMTLYNVDGEALGAATGNVQPNVSNTGTSAEAERIANLERQVLIQNTTSIDSQIETLKSSGQVPFYSEVENDMIAIVDAHVATGRPIPALKELYDLACKARPDILQKIASGHSGANSNGGGNDTVKRVERRKRKLAKSKRAARNIGTSGKESQRPTKPMSLREELEYQYDRFSAQD